MKSVSACSNFGRAGKFGRWLGRELARLICRGRTAVPGFYDTHLHVDSAYDSSYKGPGIRHTIWSRNAAGQASVTRDEFLRKWGEFVRDRDRTSQLSPVGATFEFETGLG